VVALVAAFAVVVGGISVAFAAAGSIPTHTKLLTDNHDGTYTLSLDVVGESERKPNPVNVIVILDHSGSMDEQTGGYGSQTRMAAAQNAVNNLARSLFNYNTTEFPELVEMALVGFSTTGSVTQAPTTSYNTFSRAVNGLDADGGTNWEDALQDAAGINFGDSDPTYVIFVSDGNPTFRMTRGSYDRYYNDYYLDNWGRQQYGRIDDLSWSSQGVYGNGQDVTTENVRRSYNEAVDDARALATAVGADHFYTIGAYGNVSRMQSLTTDAGAPAGNYFSAANTTDLQNALAAILAQIEKAGIGSVEIEDGTTNQVTASTGVVELLEVDTSSFKYYRDGVEWESTDTPAPPAAQFVNGAVEWDLSSLGVLDDGVKYTVTFDCYPSQYTYDTIARLKNGDLQYSELDPEIQKYIVDNENGTYSLRTNTTATLDWDDTRTDDDEASVEYLNPDPVRTDAATMSVSKEWENTLDARAVGSIEMTVLMDNGEFHKVTLTDPEWTADNIYISPGIIKNGQVLPGAEGHDFTFAELGSEQYNWELVSPTVHPMLINGTLTMLTLVDGAHPAPSGAQTYTINGKTYYSNGSSSASLDAYNYRRSNLNLTKVVTGEDAPKDATFPFTLTVNNSKASSGSASDTNSDYYVWFSIYDTNAGATVMDATVSGTGLVGPSSSGYYYIPSGTAITVEMQAGWNLRFTNLPTGTTYTFAEGNLATGFAFNKAELTSGTDSKFSGGKTTTGTVENTNTSYVVTYTNDYQLTDLEITKKWVDNNNQDGKRLTADELKAKLTLSPAVQGKEPIVKDNGDGTYTITYTGLPRFNNGQEVKYTVAESAIDDYETTGSPAKDHGTITNTHTPEETEATVKKVWDDADNQDGKRPTELKVTLSNGTEVTLNEDNGWTATVENLPKYKDGEEIDYTWTEDEEGLPEGYELTDNSKDGTVTTLTNSYTPEETSATVKKVWDDANNQDGKRPTELKVTLSNGTEVTLNEGNGWTATVDKLPKYADGKEIVYTWTEGTLPEGYTLTGTSTEGTVTTLTNSYTPEETEATVKKVWDDADDQDGKRPTELLVELLANAVETGKKVTLDASNNWTGTITGLDVYADGQKIVYEWREVLGDVYKLTGTVVEGTVTTLTNSYTPEETEATVKKVWDDADNQDGKRPESLTVTLSDGQTVTLNEDNGWTATIEGLPKYKDGGKEIEYTWTEGDMPEGYTLSDSSADGTVTTLTNSYKPEETEATVKKVWDDADDQDGKRPESLTVTLSDGQTVTLNEGNGWTATIEGLPKYAGGKEIEYTWTEGDMPEGYELTDTSVEGTVTTLTNSYTPEETEATVKKVWDDADNQDGKRPESLDVTLSDGQTVTLNEGNGWTATIEGLPKYENGGQEITYTWTEGTLPEGYTLTGTSTEGTVTTLTNSYTPEETEATVKKVWDDAENQDGIRPASLVVTLSDGQTVTLSEGNDWEATITGLPKYESGQEITYTWTEASIEGYELTNTSTEGTVTTLTNKHTPEETEATVKKVWDDADNQDGKRPESLDVTLSDGQTVTLSEGNGWTATIEGLPKYAGGQEIEYTWTEASIEDYTLTGSAKDGTVTTLTNKHVPEQISIDVEKVWEDADNQDGKRPESVTVNLLVSGDIADTVELNEDNGWKYTWTKLDKYAGGEEIKYTVEEVKTDVITGTDGPGTYADEVTGEIAEGYIVTNTHTPETVDVSVKKVWDDDDDRDGKQPDSIDVTLSNGDKVTLGASNNWEATIEGLPKYNNGEEIAYTWTEASIDGYELTNTGTEGYVTTLTNSHMPEQTTVTVTKTWDDADDKDGIRPVEINVTLLANGEEAGTAVLSDSNGWTHTWDGLYKYEGGKEIAYTVSEEPVEGYDEPEITGTAADGYTIKNHHKATPDPVTIDPPVQKIVKGNPATPETFTFQMKAITDGAPMPEGSEGGVKTIQITGTGSDEFGVVTYTEAGEWVYEITEVDGGVKNYTYDTTVYTLTVSVEEVADGSQAKLVKTETITGGDSITFTNVYEEQTTPPDKKTPPKKKIVIPQTGDDTPTGAMAALTVFGAAALTAGTVLQRRKRK
jgi:pilin isopeptide linkage protein